MESRTLKSDLLLLVTAFIWGTTFVAQRKGMDHIGPLTYNTFRFALGGIVLLPIIFGLHLPAFQSESHMRKGLLVRWAGLAGLCLFAGSTLQQTGLVDTTAGKAGFITGLYVVIVPILGLVLRHRIGMSVWLGAVMAVVGLYFLSITGSWKMNRGDFLVLLSAFFWAIHVLLIGYLARRAHPLHIACLQFFVCSALSFIGALLMREKIVLSTIYEAAIPILYGGILSAGIAFSLQVICQRNCPPAHAAIIMSLETVFAALAGWVVLHEILTSRNILGCALMLTGMLVVQLAPLMKNKKRVASCEL